MDELLALLRARADGLTIGELRRHLKLGPSSAARLVSLALAQGWMRREGRSANVRYFAGALERAEELRKLVTAFANAVDAGVTAGDLRARLAVDASTFLAVADLAAVEGRVLRRGTGAGVRFVPAPQTRGRSGAA